MEGKLFEDFDHVLILLMLGNSSVIVCVLSKALRPTSKGKKDKNGKLRQKVSLPRTQRTIKSLNWDVY